MNLNIRQNRILSVFSILAYLVMILVNLLAVKLPLNGVETSEISDRYKNLFTPAGLTFSIWGVIYLLLAGFVVYQAVIVSRQKENFSPILKLFLISSVANAAWLISWHSDNLIACQILMIILLISLIKIHNIAGLSLPLKPFTRKLFVDLPFSIYLGWICVATIANASALLVKHEINLGLTEEAWAIIMISFASVAAIFMTWYKNNYAFSLVIIWALYGILRKRIEEGNSENLGPVIFIWMAAIGIVIILRIISRASTRERKVATN